MRSAFPLRPPFWFALISSRFGVNPGRPLLLSPPRSRSPSKNCETNLPLPFPFHAKSRRFPALRSDPPPRKLTRYVGNRPGPRRAFAGVFETDAPGSALPLAIRTGHPAQDFAVLARSIRKLRRLNDRTGNSTVPIPMRKTSERSTRTENGNSAARQSNDQPPMMRRPDTRLTHPSRSRIPSCSRIRCRSPTWRRPWGSGA